MKKLLLTSLLVLSSCAAKPFKFEMVENYFPEKGIGGLQAYTIQNTSNSRLIMEVQCESTIHDVNGMTPPGLGVLEPNQRFDFGVFVNTDKISAKRPVAPQCYIRKWIKW